MAKRTAKKAQQIWIELENKLNYLNQVAFPKVKQHRKEIENYNSELLIDSENTESIKTKIINLEKEIEANSVKAKSLTEEILELHTEIFEGEEGEGSMEDKFRKFLSESENLFSETGSKKEDFDLFYNKVFGVEDKEGKIVGGLDKKIDQIQKEIDVRKKDIDVLLERVTSGSLLDGFLKSKKEYKQIPEYNLDEKNKIVSGIKNSLIFISNRFSIAFEYILFILPLIISVIIFVQPALMEGILGGDSGDISDFMGSLNFMEKLIISLPLWWISWFGQRSISQKRRLAEEYNHKARVTEMYLNFSSRETSDVYPITSEAKNKLDELLIDTIKRNPVQVYGKDETMIDKVIESIKATKSIVTDSIEKSKDVVSEDIVK